ncbi:right-handed parallel beta-helix repeat-containing protein [Sphingomonas desiccabilis]|nr:right-handed parallel beta-helix repeat-containing protein [Sphingomonas desiccabilis]MBB3912708.1 hypothetical protein [Sphingomonas desiccabilis]
MLALAASAGGASMFGGALAAPPEKHALVLRVAADGDDANDALTRPVRTVARALAMARTLRARGKDDRVIEIALTGGTYWLDRPIRIGAADSGTPGAPLTLRAEGQAPVLIAGGPVLSQWRPAGDGTVEAALPAGATCPAQLFVNGSRRDRSRLPQTGFFLIGAVAPSSTYLADRFQARSGDLPPNFVPAPDTQAVVLDTWNVSRVRVMGYDPATRTLRLQRGIPGHNSHRLAAGIPYFLDNVSAGPLPLGAWLCNPREGRVRYRPTAAEAGKPLTAAAPVLSSLLRIEGAAGVPVHDIVVRGLRFAFAGWDMPATGWVGHVDEVGAGAAIALGRCRAIRLERLEVAHTGGAGVGIAGGCSDVELSDGSLTDLGGGGVMIGSGIRRVPVGSDWAETFAREGGVTHDVRILRNRFASLGRVLIGSAGIWSGQAHHVAIVGNEVSDLFYSGISIGWHYGGGPGVTEGNLVENNSVKNYGQGVLSDMGGIYTLGPQPGTVVRRNRVSAGRARDYGGWGLYADELSSGITFSDNTVSDTSSAGIHVHRPGATLTFARNIVRNAGEAGIRCTPRRAEADVRFVDNRLQLAPGTAERLYCELPQYRFVRRDAKD